MRDTAPSPAPGTGQAPPRGEHVVVLAVDVRTQTERRLVTEWARLHRPGAEIVDQDLARLASVLGAGDRLVVPIRITWLPRERDGERRVRLRDLALLTHPRRPRPAVQSAIAAREPERVRVSVGEPATASELRARFAADVAAGGSNAFAEFVVRQATIATERAERAIIGDRYKIPRLVAEQITADGGFRSRVDALADRLGRPAGEVLADAEICLKELATVQSALAIDLFRAFMRPMHARAWTVRTDIEALERLRDLNRGHALVFLPTHRSYVDPLVLGDVLLEHDFPRNHLIGGENMAFWPIGPLGRRAGLVFIRRQFGDDPIYKLAMREFLSYLVSKRFNIEWYMEGGRTRTGKLRPPKLGLLRYLVAALEDGRTDDLVLVPTSIVYDRLPEVHSLTAESSGATKPREGLRWFANYIRAQRHNVGTARVSFGEPVSLAGALADAGEGTARLEKVAFRVCDAINHATPVTAPSLVTLALLGAPNRALTLEQVARIADPLLAYLERRSVPRADELRGTASLRAGLDGLVEAGAVELHDAGPEAVWRIAQGGHHVAAFYRNGALHHLVNRAIVELAVLQLAEGERIHDPLEGAWQDALALRDLLKFEFFFADKPRFRAELEAELDLLAADWRDRITTPEGAAGLIGGSPLLVANRVLRSFLEAQVVAAKRLASRGSHDAGTHELLIEESMGLGGQMVLQARLHGADSVSRELFGAALRLAANRGLLDAEEGVGKARVAWLKEVREVVARLRRIEELETALLEEALDGIGR